MYFRRAGPDFLPTFHDLCLRTSEILMKRTTSIGSLLALNLAVALCVPAATNTLLATAAGPLGSGSDPGLLVRTAQAPEDAAIPNNLVRAIRQLNGTLIDDNTNAVPDQAIAGPNADGSYPVDTINFERDGLPVDLVDTEGNVLASFAATTFPGIPGTGGHTSRFAVEVVAFVELPAGSTTFGVAVSTDRTDVNDDDSYRVFVAENPRDFFGLQVGQFERFAPPFVSETRNENRWTVLAPQAGIYPFRIVYWQGDAAPTCSGTRSPRARNGSWSMTPTMPGH
jgi:hypothetical protein